MMSSPARLSDIYFMTSGWILAQIITASLLSVVADAQQSRDKQGFNEQPLDEGASSWTKTQLCSLLCTERADSISCCRMIFNRGQVVAQDSLCSQILARWAVITDPSIHPGKASWVAMRRDGRPTPLLSLGHGNVPQPINHHLGLCVFYFPAQPHPHICICLRISKNDSRTANLLQMGDALLSQVPRQASARGVLCCLHLFTTH